VLKVVLFASLITFIVTGGQMALAAQAGSAAGSSCTLVVPADPLSATGLATPYELIGPCHETNPATAAFVQGTIVDPATGGVSVYDPLVVDRGKLPAVAPTPPRLPAGAVVGLWFGFNGDSLVLRGTGNSLAAGRCVSGLDKSGFGQFAYCNAPAFFSAANAAIDAGRLAIPALGTASDGLPCPTVRDFGLVDMDQSDNVTTAYLFLRDGSTAQNTAADQAALATMGAKILINGSDNALLDDFLDPALGCTPYTAPDLAQPGRLTTSLALNELQAARFQAQPVALVPLSDPMVLVNGKANVRKANLYRTGVGQPPVDAAADTPQAYCRDLVGTGPARIQRDRTFTRRGRSPDSGAASDLFTFLAQRLSGAFDTLDCGTLLKRKNPVTIVTDKNGVAVDARFAAAVPPTPAPSVSPRPTGAGSPTPTHGGSPTPTHATSPTPIQPTTPTPTSTHAASPTPTVGESRNTSPPPSRTGVPATARVPAPPPPTVAEPTAAVPTGGNPAPPGAEPAGGPPAGAVQLPIVGQPVEAPAPAASQQSAGPAGPATQPAPPPDAPTVVSAPVHHVANGAHTLPLTGSAPVAVLAVSSALLTIGIGVRFWQGWRRRQPAWRRRLQRVQRGELWWA
jgi:hypothetical protein